MPANMGIDTTLVSQAFDAGNYAAGYVSTDLETAWQKYRAERRFAECDKYRPAFVLGFYASHEAHEIPDDDADAHAEALASDVGRVVLAAGYIDPPDDNGDEGGA